MHVKATGIRLKSLFIQYFINYNTFTANSENLHIKNEIIIYYQILYILQLR